MAIRKTVTRAPLEETYLRLSKEDATRQIQDQIDKGKLIRDRPFSSHEQLQTARRDYSSWSEYNRELLRQVFTNERYSREYDGGGGIGFARLGPTPVGQQIQELREDVDGKMRKLESIRDRLPIIPSNQLAMDSMMPAKKGIASGRVFLVHGHDDAARESVARFLERLDLDVVILHEQGSGGRTVIEKIEANSTVSFAVVLLTADDIGGPKNSPKKLLPRARQNVILELGYFIGKLGRKNVAALYENGVEIPSDYDGVVWIPLKGNEWQLPLGRELRDAGTSVDLNRI